VGVFLVAHTVADVNAAYPLCAPYCVFKYLV